MKTILSFLFSAGCVFAFAQSSKTTVALDKKQDVSNIIPLSADGGFLLHVSEQYAGREKNSDIYCYSPDLKKKWVLKIDKATNNLLDEFLVGSIFSDYTYYVQQVKSRGEYHFTRINSDGKSSVFDCKMNAGFNSGSKIATYVDQTGLNFLMQKSVKGKKDENAKTTIEIHQIAHNSKQPKVLETNIKELLSDDENDAFIEFMGHDENNIYLAQKFISVNENMLKYIVYTIDKKEYGIVDESEFIAEIDNEMVASTNLRSGEGSEIYNKDYDVSTTYSGNRTTITYYANSGAFGCAKLDVASGRFIIYGLTTDKKFSQPKADKKGKKASYTLKDNIGGGYVIAYDFNTGKKLHEQQFLLDKSVTSDMSSAFYIRAIWFDILNDHTYRIGMSRGQRGKKTAAHAVVINAKAKTEYKKIEFPARENENLWHTRYVSNILLTNSIAPDAAVKFYSQASDIRTKAHSKFGLLLPNKIILFKNQSLIKSPKIEVESYDILK